jgi:RHS repeat-associated protein
VIGEHVGSTSYYYLHDNLGSVVAVISASGAVQDRDAYDPYGNITSSSGTLSNPIGYVSGYIDSATGLVQFGARYYNPGVGLFTQEDPSGQSIGYLYVGDNPVNGTDPSGYLAVTPLELQEIGNGLVAGLGAGFAYGICQAGTLGEAGTACTYFGAVVGVGIEGLLNALDHFFTSLP